MITEEVYATAATAVCVLTLTDSASTRYEIVTGEDDDTVVGAAIRIISAHQRHRVRLVAVYRSVGAYRAYSAF